MKYDNIFWFHSEETNEGSIYNRRKRKERTLSNAVQKIWQGECTKSELKEKVKEYEKNKRNY